MPRAGESGSAAGGGGGCEKVGWKFIVCGKACQAGAANAGTGAGCTMKAADAGKKAFGCCIDGCGDSSNGCSAW